jgi:class 3 adenylate cyclase/tetratricopeptide (TPR) repeat protein
VSDVSARFSGHGEAYPERDASIDELLDRAVAASNRGDRVTATALAGQVLAVEGENADAEDLLAAPPDRGELRRLTILFADLVDSTALSTRLEPETYRLLVGRYRDLVLEIVARFEGHVGSTKGDGVLAVFGHPRAHENDVRRAVQAGLEITRDVARLSDQARRRLGVSLGVRVGVHRGLVYLDTAQDDVYGLAANLAARVCALAPANAVVVSDAVSRLVRNNFDLEARPAAAVKGVEGLIGHCQVIGERVELAKLTRGPLVGRDSELARLQKCWARAQTGTLTTPGMVFRGEPGIGKSRLAAAAVDLAETAGAVVLELMGSPFHTDAGLHPVRALLERRCHIGRRTEQPERLRLLEVEVQARGLDSARVVPLLAPVLGIGTEHGYEPVPAEGRRLYELIAAAVHDYLLACVGGRPGLLVAEDVHWFDTSTVEVLGALLKASSGRLLAVLTGRPGGWLPAAWPVKVVDLNPLTDEQSDQLIAALEPGLAEDDRAAVARRCDGMPFYIEQVVNGLGETGVPEALYEQLFARLRASGNVVPVVEAAAVIGRHVDRGLLRSAVDLAEDDFDDVIDELENALVFEPWGTGGWRFRHELLREIAAELAPPSVRRGLHAKVADALVEGGGDPDWRLVAGHYEQAERLQDAASAYQKASTAARQRGALPEARAYLGLALAGLERATPGPGRDRRELALRLERGFLAGAVEGTSSPAAAADFERCLELGSTDLGDDEVFASLLALGGYYATRADLPRMARVVESLSAGFREDLGRFGPMIETGYGVMTWLRGEFATARFHLERATASQAVADHHDTDAVWFIPIDPVATARIHLALVGLVRGGLSEALAELADTARWVEQLGFPQGPYSHAYALWAECWLWMEAGRPDRAAVAATAMTDVAERHGFDSFRELGAGMHAAAKAQAALSADNLDPCALVAAIQPIATFVDASRLFGQNAYTTFFDALRARLLLAAGQPEQARDRLNMGLQLADDTGMHFYDAELLRLRAHAHTDPDARRADLDAALRLARHQGATLFELRVALDDFELRGQSARAALADVVSRLPAGSEYPELTRAVAALKESNNALG